MTVQAFGVPYTAWSLPSFLAPQAGPAAPAPTMAADAWTPSRPDLAAQLAALTSAVAQILARLDAMEGARRPAPAPAPVAPPAAPPPITIEIVRDAAREYLASHPELNEAESYVEVRAVAQLREGVIAILAAKGYRVGRILGPDGQPYDQMVAFGDPNDPDAHAYRVTAGGGPIRRAITVGYCDENVPWSHVH